MPYAALRPCAEPGCPTLTSTGRCVPHARAQARAREAVRRPLSQRGWYHTTRWKRLRMRFLSEHPVCESCPRPANTVDHRVPHDMDEAKFWDWNNLRAQCVSCHSRKTAAQDGGFGNRRTA